MVREERTAEAADLMGETWAHDVRSGQNELDSPLVHPHRRHHERVLVVDAEGRVVGPIAHLQRGHKERAAEHALTL